MIILSKDLFSKFRNSKRLVFYSVVKFQTIKKLQGMAESRKTTEFVEMGGTGKIIAHIDVCMILNVVSKEKQTWRAKVKMIASKCGEFEEINDSFHGYELETLDF